LIELLISACLAGEPQCKEFSLLYDPREVSLMTCMMMGQAEMAKWQQEHPAWHIERWTCAQHDQSIKEI
jgi:hypothetical protein